MAYDDTDVPVARSQESIRQMVMAHKGTGVMFVSQPPSEGFEALVTLKDRAYHIRITAKCRSKGRPEQEQRRVWRVLFYHLKALFQAVDSEVLTIEELILPYIVTYDGRTIAEHVLPRLQEAVTRDPMFLLPQKGSH